MKRRRYGDAAVAARLSAFFALLALFSFIAGIIGIIDGKAGAVVIGFVLFVFFGLCGWWVSPRRIRRAGNNPQSLN